MQNERSLQEINTANMEYNHNTKEIIIPLGM